MLIIISALFILLIFSLLLFKKGRNPPLICGPELPLPDSIFSTGAVLEKGEVLTQLLKRYCIADPTINTIYTALHNTDFNFRNMKAGDSVTLYYHGLNLAEIEYHPNLITTYKVYLDSGGTFAQKITKPVDTVKCVFAGTIENSLWNSLLKISGTPALVVEFAEILRYDIDFFTECNDGDTFELLVDKLTVEGKLYRYGRIYAVHFRSKTKNVYGFYFPTPSGHWDYYNERGQSLRKAVLRSPLSYAKVSSHFGMRFHPILRIYRPHQGVDYVAPRGTPVSAVADGTITKARWANGYGNLVEIKHSGGLISRYGHLSGYGPRIKEGKFVRQGATVGYVGATGLATGPHLHFEIRQGGKPVDPLKVIPPRAEPVPRNYIEMFNKTKDEYLAIIKRATASKEVNLTYTHIPISISK
ncbi:MAG: peptidoglycan DD-metalloendopeptidase family protein [bacterium]